MGDTKVPDEWRDIIQHSLGVTRAKKPYRRHYCAVKGNATLAAIADAGLMDRGAIINDGAMQYFYVNEAGAKAVGHKLPKD